MAGEFDAHERQMWAGAAKAYAGSFAALCAGAAEALLDAAGVREGVRVLDVGTGPGTIAAAALARGAEVVAVDAEPSMVELAAANAPGAEVRHGVLPELPFADGSFDAVVGNFVVNHVEDPWAALTELRRVARPGGRLAVTVWHATANEAMSLFNQAMDEAGVVRPSYPAPMSFTRTVEGLCGLLEQAGLAEVAGRELAWTHREDPEVWWSGPAGGVAGIGRVMSEQTPGMYARVKTAYDRLAAGRLGGDGLIGLPAVAVLASGRCQQVTGGHSVVAGR
ncbi:class I SAM-dependent methyltransferase [Streptomyces sp. NRRL F-5126]|uniref:class I SAM-dependent methyltransferase n=1 Tax=Streptomyces sp. NRRL F-5126 TaxID=1463857 RepID=UPI00068DE105|nr:class I SAM-dependent methyltransferase [Streptomyces sp. NRRL F-5126]